MTNRATTTRAALALLCVLLSACGVRAQDGPERLPADVLPSELRRAAAHSAAPSTAATAATVTVYLVEGGRLVRETRPAGRRALEDALDVLLTAGQAQGTRRSAVPAGTVVERLRSRDERLSIELSAQFAEVRGLDQVLAVAQLVWTATEYPPVREVELFVDGRRIDLPTDEGEVSPGPAGRDDYLTVGPAR